MVKVVSVLIPVYNEELALLKLYKRLADVAKKNNKYRFEFLFVNDGSRDKSLEIIKDMKKSDNRVAYIDLSRNYGKEVAMIAGLDHVDSDATIVVDADLQDPPELITEMIRHWEDGYDDVYARRTERAGESWLRRKTSSVFYRVLQHSTEIPIQRDAGDFRLLDKKCVMAIRQFRERERYTKGIFSWIGYRKKEITYVRQPRVSGKSKWSYLKLVNLAINGIISFTTAPLRASTIIGLVVSLIAFIYILFLVIRTMLFGVDVAGYPSIMAVVLFLGGVQLISLGIIGEYISRIYNETKQRPLYLVDEYHEAKVKK